MSGSPLAYIAVTAAMIIWGASFVATKIALSAVPPYTLVFARFSLAAAVLFPLWLWRRREKLHLRHLLGLGLLGLLDPGLYYVFETLGLLHTSASAASLIIAAVPVFVTVLAALFLHESVKTAGILGIILTMIGVAFLTVKDFDVRLFFQGSWFGNLLILGAALCAACYTIISRRLSHLYHTWTLTLIQVGIGTLVYLPLAISEWHRNLVHQAGAAPVAAVVFLSLFATLGAFLLYNFSLGTLEASRAAVFINVVPLVTVIIAWLYLHEHLDWRQSFGGMLIVSGVFLTTDGIRLCRSFLQRPTRRRHSSYDWSEYGAVAALPAEEDVEGAGPAIAAPGTGEGQNEPF